MSEVWIAGSTGLVGHHIVDELAKRGHFQKVHRLARKDFEQGLKIEAESGCDYFCALGTTIKKAGSQEAFRLVDETYVVKFASEAKRNGARVLVIVSAVGAEANSRVFYNKVKGEMEAAVKSLGLESVYVLHPSLLLGHRNETRLGEQVASVIAPLISPLLIGPAAKYRPVRASRVAARAVDCAMEAKPGFHIVEPV